MEREGDLGVLGALLADARAGEGRLVVIEGPAGIGKTRLLDEARAAAERMDMDVLAARGGELERDFGFGVVRQLLEPRLALADESERAELFAGAAGLAEAVVNPRSAAATPAGDLSHASLHGLYWLVANLAERSPLLIAVDDVQWADGPTLRFLHRLVVRLEGLPVAIVACRRTGEASPEPELLDGLVLEADVLRPAKLSGDAVASIVRARLGEAVEPELCEACLESSRGNPFLLGELLLELGQGQRESTSIDPEAVRELGPGRIATAVLLRIGRLGPGARDLARALAVLGEVDDLSRAGTLAGLEPGPAAEIADSLTELAVLSAGRPVGFTHPVVRTAIYEEMPASERARLHRHAAALLGDDPERAASHLILTDPNGDEGTVAVLRAAARDAQARGAADSPMRYLRRALAEPPGPAVRGELLAELGVAGWLIGEADAADLLQEAFDLIDDPAPRAATATVLAAQLLNCSPLQTERAVSVLERSLEDLDDSPLRIEVEAMLLTAGISALEARQLVAPRLRSGPARVERLTDERAVPLLAPLAIEATMSATAPESIRLAQRGLADGAVIRLSIDTGLPFVHLLSIALTFAGEQARAEDTLSEAIAQLRDRGALVPVAMAAGYRAYARYLGGRLAAAEADACLCLEEPVMAGRPLATSPAAAAQVLVLIARGRLAEARRAQERFEAAGHDPELAPFQLVRVSRASLLAAEGEHATALETLQELERFERDWGVRTGVFAWRSQAARCHLMLGNDREARSLAEEELELARRFGAPRAIGVALHAHALVHDADQKALAEAIELLAGCGAALEHARALIDLGSAIRRGGERVQARETLTEGADLAHRCGATALVDHALEELRLAGARPRRITQTGRDALTPAELRVVELAAEGQTNKQIAQALFVTLRTVEMHLSNSYRKLGIESRSQLAAALAEDM